MRFASHARRIKYVVAGHPRRKFTTTNGDIVTDSGLEARFLNHSFDSERAQENKGWTDQDRKIVEEYLLGHPDFDRPGGFYLDMATANGKSKADLLREAGHPWEEAAQLSEERCMFFYADPDHPGEVAQCPATVVEGSEFCQSHQPEVVVDEQGPAPAPEPVAVAAAPKEDAGWSMPPVGG